MKDFNQKFYDITALIQHEFDRNMEVYGDKIQCRKGCSQCCSQIFRITKLDGWIISEHIRSLPEVPKSELQQKAREYLLRLPLSKSKNWLDSGEGVLNADHPGYSTNSLPLDKGECPPKAGEGVPCPALGSEGECTIYEARPVICRRFGMPIYDYKNPESVHACELNFKDGDEITDDKLIPNQTEIGMKWDELKDEFMQDHPALRAPLLAKEGTKDRLPINKSKNWLDSGEWSKTEKVEGTTIAEAIANA